MYAEFARVAAGNEYAWSYGGEPESEETIARVEEGRNRMICFPCRFPFPPPPLSLSFSVEKFSIMVGGDLEAFPLGKGERREMKVVRVRKKETKKRLLTFWGGRRQN